MSDYRLQLVTPPAVEPVTLAEAKLHLRQDLADDDALITSLIVAARRFCEASLRQSLITQTWDYFADYGAVPFGMGMVGGGYFNRTVRQMGLSPFWLPTNAQPLELPRPPLQSVSFFKYVDPGGVLQTVSSGDYLVSPGKPGRIQPAWGKAWPIPRPQIDAVQIRYVTGYGDTASAIDENVKAAMKLCIGHWYEHRESVTEGQPLTTVPMAVTALLSPSEHGFYA